MVSQSLKLYLNSHFFSFLKDNGVVDTDVYHWDDFPPLPVLQTKQEVGGTLS